MSYVLAIGVAETEPEALSPPSGSPPKLNDILQRCAESESFKPVSSTTGYLLVDEYSEVEDLITRISDCCQAYNSTRSNEAPVRFFVAVTWRESGDNQIEVAGRAQTLLGSTMAERRRAEENLPIIVLISSLVYARLKQKHKDLYRPATEIQGIQAHERYPGKLETCFVISPIGDEGSPQRQRADEVFEAYIKAALEKTPYRPVRGDAMYGTRVTPEIEEALLTNPIVIAYLGSPKPGWNANVMYEFGQRKASGLPYVVLKDEFADGKKYPMPFDLKDERFVDLPEKTPDNFDDLAAKIRRIRTLVENAIIEPAWSSVYPTSVVDIPIGSKDKEPTFVEASASLEDLFDLSNIKGRTVLEVVENIARKMPASQCAAFLADQEHVLGSLVIGRTEPKKVSANVPIVFEHHKTLSGRAFLPVISRHKFIKPTSTFRVEVVYIDVTSATKCINSHFECSLAGSALLDFEKT